MSTGSTLTEATEVLSGYYVIETDTLDFAHDVAARREVVDMISQAAGVRGMMQERMMP